MKNIVSRRAFLQRTAAVAAGGMLVSKSVRLAAQPEPPVPAPSDRMRFGIIGVGMEGSGLLTSAISIPGVECVGAADLYDGRHTLAKELTGDTPSRLLNRFRVRLSQLPLRNGQKTITEIAFNSGFSSSQYFSRIFKDLIGITPSQYRQRRGNLAVYDRRFLQILTELKASRNGFKLAKD